MLKYRFLIMSLIASAFLCSFNLGAEEELSESEEAIVREMAGYDWKEPGKYKLNKSKSTLVIPEGYSGFVGQDAIKYQKLIDYQHDPSIEAVVFTEDFEGTVVFSCYNEGYVSLSDWGSVDSSQLLKGIIENTEKANVERRKKGASPLHVTGWVQEPTLDKHTNTVFWAIEGYAENDGIPIINSVAIRLGRKGFERVNWITDKERYTPFGGELDIMLRSHSFDPGYRYSDFSKGDKIASYGIASLVAATVGGKVVKAGGFLVVFKKLWGVIAAGIGALFYKLKNLFRRNRDG